MTAQINNFTLTSGPPGPPCMVQHNAPALLFSPSGRLCTRNFFHAFNDGLIPLFITVHTIFPDDQDRVLLISGSCDWWARKYMDLLQSFSKHRIITLGNDTATHCFPSATVGLVGHGFMAIQSNLMANPKTLMHFHALLEKTYGQKRYPRNSHFAPPVFSKPRPRLALVSRSGGIGRVISNQAELRQVAEEEGFEVIELEPKFETSLSETYKLVSPSHVMVGVHGAALTHLLFLRPGSVVIQVVPLGLQWTSEVCFGKPAKEMGLEYMEYEIGVEESSLVEKYERDNLVIKDPMALQKKQWSTEIMNIYLKEQNVKLDMVRFRKYLKKAYEKAKKFMEKEGQLTA
ncbi:Protein O-linked-mannose beta-1,4-N-acetylglucosaminyltransferase [Actinidia chinensis var. chinensis]|uniref:Protein O-linked-mannose beta-1,4-N-acetylglucosaminyltransferase n=1 Tax=Actinidia chinensis var. chinensis TaxID=1590841 RepID=A0A2R6QQW8_ACTCC|nr:Protein O-linked-mannose beta-1,4-N-acetylglucosaminyltransferase [Actinidia chinensis var. chinensis]